MADEEPEPDPSTVLAIRRSIRGRGRGGKPIDRLLNVVTDMSRELQGHTNNEAAFATFLMGMCKKNKNRKTVHTAHHFYKMSQ